ncbi:MAG TPA: ABC transporter permease [Candidatus Acidoferrales bacterium]|nr:ABC transporter permease [Candidatus Acidoferrales bacterium]
MIAPIVRTSLISLKRDRGALVLSFILPVAFFTIFAVIFGGRRDSTPKVRVLVVDEDRTPTSQRLLKGLEAEGSLTAFDRPAPKNGVEQPDYTAETAELAVKAGTASVALIIPRGFGAHPLSFGPDQNGSTIQLLKDSSDMIAPQIVEGLLQKVAMTSMPDSMIEQGTKYFDEYAGGLTPQQHKIIEDHLNDLRREQSAADGAAASPGQSTTTTQNAGSGGMLLSVTSRDVVGENKNNPMVSFYAAAIGVMFLLFTASGTSGSLLDEAESGTLDRVLSSRVTMGSLLAGKLCYGTALAFAQLVVMFVWAWLQFKIEFIPHLLGFAIMGISTAFAVSAFGMLLASICRTRAQLGPLSTLVILIMSSVGGSMFPRFLMPEAMQKAGLLTINAWAIDGFTKVFWRDEPISHLWPQVLVLVVVGTVLFAIARRIARRWEFA